MSEESTDIERGTHDIGKRIERERRRLRMERHRWAHFHSRGPREKELREKCAAVGKEARSGRKTRTFQKLHVPIR